MAFFVPDTELVPKFANNCQFQSHLLENIIVLQRRFNFNDTHAFTEIRILSASNITLELHFKFKMGFIRLPVHRNVHRKHTRGNK